MIIDLKMHGRIGRHCDLNARSGEYRAIESLKTERAAFGRRRDVRAGTQNGKRRFKVDLQVATLCR